MNTKNEVFEYLIGQLRQQVNNNQCEDLAHEVQSLKNQLRDASAQIKELHLALVQATGDVEAYKLLRKGVHIREQSGCRKEDVQVEKSWVEHDGAAACPVPDDTVVDIKFRNGEVESNTKALSWRWDTWGGPYDIVAYRVVKPECEHDWRVVQYSAGVETDKCRLCGVEKEVHYKPYGRRKEDAQECEHVWYRYNLGGYTKMCVKCGLKK